MSWNQFPFLGGDAERIPPTGLPRQTVANTAETLLNRGLHILRFAARDLRDRLLATLFVIFVIGILVASTQILGFYYSRLYDYNSHRVEDLAVCRFSVCVSDPNDFDQLFSPRKLSQLNALPGVRRAYPKLELGVRLWVKDEPREATIEGVADGDELLSASRLAWGGEMAGAREMVLPETLYRQLKGEIVNGKLSISEVELEATRTVGGALQSLRCSFQIVGLRRAGPEERVWLPLSTADEFNRWCVNELDAAAPSQSGHVRCTVEAESPEAAEVTIAGLESEGYIVQHQLTAVKDLRELLWRLIGFMGVVQAGCLMVVMVSIVVVTVLTMQTQTQEIGILKAYGAGKTMILSVFVCEAILVGLAGYLLASLGVVLIEPWIRPWMAWLTMLPLAEIAQSGILSADTRWLLEGTLGLSLGFPLLGMLLPAICAASLRPIVALKR